MATATSPHAPPSAATLPAHISNSTAATQSSAPTPSVASLPTIQPPPTSFIAPADVEGISRLWLWNVPSVPVALTSLTSRLQSVFGASRSGRWWTTCDHLAQKRPPATTTPANTTASPSNTNTTTTAASATQSAASKELYCLTFSSHPDRTHCISASVNLTSSAALTSFLTTTAGYTARSTYQVEGETFTLGDFTLALGTLRHNTRYTSTLLLQLTYHPCCQPTPHTFHLLQSVIESLLLGVSGSDVLGGGGAEYAVLSYRPLGGWPVFVDFGLGGVWTARHRALMWLFVLQMSRATT